MKKFGIYIFNLSKDNPSTGVLSTDTMVGEVDMTSKSYEGLSVDEACKKRIASELSAKVGTSFYTIDDVRNLKMLTVEAEKESHIDTFLRKEIIKRTSAEPVWTYDDSKTELLRFITVEQVYDEICKVYNPEARRTHSYGLREYQQQIVDKAAKTLESHKEVLINLSTRGGKSFVSLELAKKIGAQNILILTPYPAAEGSFRSEIECHTDFAGWKFYAKDSISVDTKYEPALNCVFLSFAQHWQNLSDKELQAEDNKLVSLVSQIHFDVVIVDETHTTSASYRSSQILSSIPHEHEVHLSGTPYNDLMTGRFTDDNTVTLDFIDLIKWDKEHKGSKDAVNFPELSVKLVSNMKELNEKLVEFDPDAFSNDADFSFEKAFGDPRDKTLAKPITFAKWLFAQNIFTDYSHYLVFVPSVKVAKMFPEVLKKVQTEFAVMGLNDEDVDSNYEKQINDFEQRNKKTIIITCAKCTTGVTLRRCDAIVLLKRVNSAETFVQTLFRCMTPFNGKTKAALFELDSEAAYKVVREVAAVHNALHAPKQSELDTYRELLDCMAIESWNSEKLEFQTELATQFLEKVKSIPTYYNMEDVFDLDRILSSLTKNEQLTLLDSDFGKSDKAAAQYIVGQNENATGIKSKSYSSKQLSELSEVKDGNGTVETGKKVSQDKLIAQIKKFLLNLDWEIILNDADTFDKLLSYEASEWNGNPQLISIYKKMLKANKRNVTDFIEQYTQITLAKAKDDPDKLMELINKLSYLNDVDKRTPPALVHKMLDKLNATKYDGSYILDPCVGTGTMLFEAWKRGWPKDHLIGTDIEPRFVKLLNKLGFENVFVKNVLDEDYGEFIKSKIGNNEFMKIIQNPPYDRNLHLKILNKIVEEFPDANIINLSPVRWLEDYKASRDLTKYKNTICKHIKSLEVQNLSEINKSFNIGSFADIGIYLLDKDGGMDFLNFWKTRYSKNDLSILDKLLKTDNLANHIESNKRDGIRVLIATIAGNRGCLPVYKDLAYVIDGKKNGIDWTKCKNNGGYEKKEGQPIPVSIKFDTEEEAQNFYGYCKTDFVYYCSKKFLIDQSIKLRLIPYLGDYTHEWANEDIYRFFNLTKDEVLIIEEEQKKELRK